MAKTAVESKVITDTITRPGGRFDAAAAAELATGVVGELARHGRVARLDAAAMTARLGGHVPGDDSESMRRMAMVQAAMATCAIPGAMPPVLRDGELLCDGGVFNNLPVDVMRNTWGIGQVIGVDLGMALPRCTELDTLPTPWQLMRDRLRRSAAPALLRPGAWRPIARENPESGSVVPLVRGGQISRTPN